MKFQTVQKKYLSIAPTYKITLVEWNHDKDHLLFKAHPKSEISKYIESQGKSIE